MEGVKGKPVVQVMELTMHNLLATGAMDRRDFLARADVLSACGMTVLISDYSAFFRLAGYLGRMTKERIGLVLGASTLLEIFDEKYYADLPGGILESFGRLFKNDLKLFIYPLQEQLSGTLNTVDTMQVSPELQKLYEYLRDRGSFVGLDNFNPEYLPIFSRDVLKRIAARDSSWEQMVAAAVADLIKKRQILRLSGVLTRGRPGETGSRRTKTLGYTAISYV